MQWLAEICVHRPVFATVIVLFLTVVGGFSFFTLGVDRFPKIDLPTITVSTSNTGAAPAEMENEVTDPIEGALNTVPGIDEMRSTSSLGNSNITLTFNLEKNPDQAYQEVQQKLSTIVNRLPENADPPVARKSDPDSQPVLQYVVSAPEDIINLSDQAQTLIEDRIESADGVGEVFAYGARQKQVKIYVNPDRLRAYNLTVTDVSKAVTAQNQELPGGTLVEGAKTVGLRTLSRLTKIEDFNDIVIATQGGFPIKVKDIGRAVAGGADATSAITLNGTQSISVGIRKQSGYNTVQVINNVKERMAQIIPTLPKSWKIAVIRDQSEFIENSLHAIEEHLILGGICAAVIVFFFLWNFRTTLIAALAIPTSIIASFAIIAALGYTLNQMTMLALTLMVGIVIDDAIVVLENIYRFVEEKGMDPFRAAVEGTREIGLAVLATTLALLAVFIPVGFMTGIVGRFMSSFGLTSAAAIAVSLIVSFTLTPMLAARWIKAPEPEAPNENLDPPAPRSVISENSDEPNSPEHSPEPETVPVHTEAHGEQGSSKSGWFYNKIDATYTWMLTLAMRFRWVVVLACILTVASIYPMFKFVGMAFLPDEDESLYQVNLRAPQGTSLAATQSILERMARDVREQLPGIQNTVVMTGMGGSNSGSINVSLLPVDQRKQAQSQLIIQTRNILKKYSTPDYRVTVTAASSIAGSIGLGRGGSGIGYYISGPDLTKLNEYANTVLKKMQTDPTFRDPDNTVDPGSPEVRFDIDRVRAADLKVQAADISQALNIAAAGQRISTYSEGTQQYDVVIQADEPFRRTRENLSYFTVSSASGTPVSLDKLVKIEEGLSPASIGRLNRQRVVTLTSSLPPNASESDALAKLVSYVKELNLPPEYTTGVTGSSKELQRAYSSFLLAFLLSFVFMYLILAAQFESFIHPVTILLTLPLSIPFALLSTAIAGQTLNIFSALGILLLFGIVKKNAILQIDHTNTLRAEGMNRYDAIIRANRDRLRPILMTTIALVAGMVPLILGSGAGAATNRSIGILVVGGQSMCLLLTLLAVPVFYSLFDDAKETTIWRSMGTGVRNFFAKFRKPKHTDDDAEIDQEPEHEATTK